jgi:hypothetical protein
MTSLDLRGTPPVHEIVYTNTKASVYDFFVYIKHPVCATAYAMLPLCAAPVSSKCHRPTYLQMGFSSDFRICFVEEVSNYYVFKIRV